MAVPIRRWLSLRLPLLLTADSAPRTTHVVVPSDAAPFTCEPLGMRSATSTASPGRGTSSGGGTTKAGGNMGDN